MSARARSALAARQAVSEKPVTDFIANRFRTGTLVSFPGRGAEDDHTAEGGQQFDALVQHLAAHRLQDQVAAAWGGGADLVGPVGLGVVSVTPDSVTPGSVTPGWPAVGATP
jgi:hypothetical protein